MKGEQQEERVPNFIGNAVIILTASHLGCEVEMLDLYSIYKTQGTLENLNIYLVGDLKYGRTVHSLLMAMRHFNPTFHFIAPEELKMPEEYKIYCREHGIKFVEHTDFTEEIIADADILYMTRVQRERFTDLMEYERVKNIYILRNKMLEHTRPNLDRKSTRLNSSHNA